MNYHLKSSRKKSSSKKYTIISLVVLVILMNMFDVPFVRNTTRIIIEPFMHVGNSVSEPFRNVGTYFSSKKNLQEEVERLEAENKLLEVRNARVSYIAQENDILREILTRKDEGADIIVADVLVKPPRSPYDTFIISLGSEEGVRVGDFVFAYETLIGIIEDVSRSSATVKLLSAPGELIDVELPGGIPAEAIGQGGGRFVITLPKDIEVEEGDRVTVTNPYAPILGVVQNVDVSDVSTFQTIHFNLPFNISTIRLVEVIPSVGNESPDL